MMNFFLDLEEGPPNLSYFCGSSGFVRPLVPLPDPTKNGLRWLDAVVTLPSNLNNNNQKELLLGQFMFIPDPKNWEGNGTRYGLVVWNDTTQQFDIVSIFPQNSCVKPVGDMGILFSFFLFLILTVLSFPKYHTTQTIALTIAH
jgi:hypothetical protein